MQLFEGRLIQDNELFLAILCMIRFLELLLLELERSQLFCVTLYFKGSTVMYRQVKTLMVTLSINRWHTIKQNRTFIFSLIGCISIFQFSAKVLKKKSLKRLLENYLFKGWSFDVELNRNTKKGITYQRLLIVWYNGCAIHSTGLLNLTVLFKRKMINMLQKASVYNR